MNKKAKRLSKCLEYLGEEFSTLEFSQVYQEIYPQRTDNFIATYLSKHRVSPAVATAAFQRNMAVFLTLEGKDVISRVGRNIHRKRPLVGA